MSSTNSKGKNSDTPEGSDNMYGFNNGIPQYIDPNHSYMDNSLHLRQLYQYDNIPVGNTFYNFTPFESNASGLFPPVYPEQGSSKEDENAHPAEECDLEQQDEDTEEGQLPEHACAYCEISHKESVAKCNSCHKWFCNNSGVTSTSHLVAHMIRSKHKTFKLHPENPLASTELECYACGSQNMFLLGFAAAKADNVVVLLCRAPCLQSANSKGNNWDLGNWSPLVQNKRIIDWLLNPSPEANLQDSIPITAGLIAKLEELWHVQPNATLEDLTTSEADSVPVQPVCVKFDSAHHFEDVMAPLVEIEAEHDKRMKQHQAQDQVSVEWVITTDPITRVVRTVAKFMFYQHEETALRVLSGDELIISRGDDHDMGNPYWEGEGTIINLGNDGLISMLITSNTDNIPIHATYGYTVAAKWQSVAFDRMRNALTTFAEKPNAMCSILRGLILGTTTDDTGIECTLPSSLSAPNLPQLNESQANTIQNVLRKKLSLVQGPPGTGKTSTSASIVYHLHRIHKKKVLVCAPSNTAVDHLTEKIYLTGLKVLRISSRIRESIPTSVDFTSLHVLLSELANRTDTVFSRLHKQHQADPTSLNAKDKATYRKLMRKAESAIIAKADVICTTCTGAGDPRLTNVVFESVLIDETTQAPEPECLIPLVNGAKQVVLVGDHCQLGPVVFSKASVSAGFNRSLFERLILLGHTPSRLQIQYRMHPALSEFPSNTFYDGTLQNGISLAERTPHVKVFNWPSENNPMMFVASNGIEEFSALGTSYLNRSEAQVVEQTVLQLVQSGVSLSQIGVITPYEGQRLHLLATLSRSSSPLISILQSNADSSHRLAALTELEIASVDAFQGREKDYIIFSCVRSNDKCDVGFLSDPRRLNVALTRARYGLVVIGNPKVLAKQPLWHALLVHFQKRNCLIEDIRNPRPCNMILPAPKLSISKRTIRIPVGFDPRTAFGMENVTSTLKLQNKKFKELIILDDLIPHTSAELEKEEYVAEVTNHFQPSKLPTGVVYNAATTDASTVLPTPGAIKKKTKK